jgi:hypothetical protein
MQTKKEPLVVGVPEIRPPLVMLRPVGSEPEKIDHVYGAVPQQAFIWWLKGTPADIGPRLSSVMSSVLHEGNAMGLIATRRRERNRAFFTGTSFFGDEKSAPARARSPPPVNKDFNIGPLTCGGEYQFWKMRILRYALAPWPSVKWLSPYLRERVASADLTIDPDEVFAEFLDAHRDGSCAG